MANGEYMTSKELEGYLRIGRNSRIKLMEAGLPFIRVERKLIFKRVDVDSFMESRRIVKTRKRR